MRQEVLASSNDASFLYEELLKKKETNPQWYVKVYWDPHSKCLRQLFYISPDQIERWLKFGNVILNDNTAATNHYEMALSLFLILQQIKKATFDATPHVIFTDANPTLIAAIQDEFPTTHALNCMFHIAQNLPLNLKSTFRDCYDEFIKDFFEVLYTNKELWAKAFVLKLFTAGMSSTSRVKSYNAKIKRLIFNSNTTLLELAEKLSVCILEEDKKTEYVLFRTLIPKTVLTSTANTIIPNVCKMLRKYLTAELLKIQEDQIKQALQYHSVKMEKNVLQRFVTSIAMGWNGPVPYLNTLVKELYGEAWGKARAVLMVAVRRNDYKFITILDKYINDNDYQEPLFDSDIDSSDSSSDEIDNGRLNPNELINPHKRKGKG
ncbi:20158_t:CDS:2 [Gigaspora rosea]|nr:20158_t:CDS:2 [Gigaspora rosea]